MYEINVQFWKQEKVHMHSIRSCEYGECYTLTIKYLVKIFKKILDYLIDFFFSNWH